MEHGIFWNVYSSLTSQAISSSYETQSFITMLKKPAYHGKVEFS
jgi:hypothetical protein